MVSDTLTALAVYFGVMAALAVVGFYLMWDRR